MAATFTPEYEVTEVEVAPADGRRRKITKFALAGVAVLGIGAALTSAAWTDNVWFRGDAHSSVLDLEGSVDGGQTWDDGDDPSGLELRIPDIPVAPGQTTTRLVHVRNNGDVPVRLSTVSATGHGDVFTAADTDLDGTPEAPASVTSDGGLNVTLNPNAFVTIEVNVTAPNWTESQFQGRDGHVMLHVEGTTQL